MPDDDRTWFITERSEALASLLLTTRPDLQVRTEHKQDDGVDLLVGVKDGESVPTKVFVVQVKGTLSSDQNDWKRSLRQLFQAKNDYYLPACIFVINVRKNESVYAWVAEPNVKGDSAGLAFFEHPHFHPLNEKAVDQIVDRVRTWYEAMPRGVVSQTP